MPVTINGTASGDTIDKTGSPLEFKITGGSGNDVLTGGAASDYIDGGSDNDTLNGCGGDDTLVGGSGNDLFIYQASENSGAKDNLDGGSGTADRLRLQLTTAEWLRADVQADLARAQTYLLPPGGKAFTFTAFGLSVKNVEYLDVSVDGQALSAADDPVAARNDAASLSEDAPAASLNLLANDSAPDLVRSVEVVSGPAHGSIVLAAALDNPASQSATLTFAPGSDFQYLRAGETAVESVTYRITDADGDIATATATFTVVGADEAGIAAPRMDSFVFGDLSHARIRMISPTGAISDTDVALSSTDSWMAQPPYGITTADISGDGRNDVVLTGDNGAGRIYLNNGDGSFTDSGARFPAAFQTRVGAGDFNHDGRLDLAFQNSSGAIDLYAQDAGGGFALVQQMPSGVNQILFADVNGDGWDDLLLSNTSEGVKLFINDKVGDDGGFYSASSALGGGLTIALADLDADGDVDAIAAQGSGSAGAVYLNDGAGLFSAGPAPFTTAAGASGVSVADIDHDGRLDALTWGESGVQWWAGDGHGGFSFRATLDASASLGGIGDIDSDRDPDLLLITGLASEQSFIASTWMNDGSGHFVVADAVQPPNQTYGFNLQGAELGTQGWI